MKTRNTVLFVLCCTLVAWMAAPALADHHEGQEGHEGHGEMSADDMAMMQVMQKAATPGEEHQMLAKAAGDWNMTTKFWMQPGAEPEMSTGTAHREMTMGGRYLVEEVDATMMGMPFKGYSMAGYDNVTGKFWNTWMDTMSTGVMVSTGTYDPATKTTTYWSENMDPMSGQMAKTKMTIQQVNDDKELMTMYMVDGDKETKQMEIVWTRAGS